jgi:hypothetical protein
MQIGFAKATIQSKDSPDWQETAPIKSTRGFSCKSGSWRLENSLSSLGRSNPYKWKFYAGELLPQLNRFVGLKNRAQIRIDDPDPARPSCFQYPNNLAGRNAWRTGSPAKQDKTVEGDQQKDKRKTS